VFSDDGTHRNFIKIYRIALQQKITQLIVFI